jgi:hypothetical protein
MKAHRSSGRAGAGKSGSLSLVEKIEEETNSRGGCREKPPPRDAQQARRNQRVESNTNVLSIGYQYRIQYSDIDLPN